MRAKRMVPLLHRTGLHLRPAKRIWDTANQFQSEVWITWKGRKANAKSLLEMVALGALPGAELQVEADGADAEEAVKALEELILKSINQNEDM